MFESNIDLFEAIPDYDVLHEDIADLIIDSDEDEERLKTSLNSMIQKLDFSHCFVIHFRF